MTIGDFDLDRDADLASANFLAGTVGVLSGNDDGTFAALMAYAAGSGVPSAAQSYRSVARATGRRSSTSGDVAGSQDQGNLSVRHEDLPGVERFVLPPLHAGRSSYFVRVASVDAVSIRSNARVVSRS